jgi:hypothetical protein
MPSARNAPPTLVRQLCQLGPAHGGAIRRTDGGGFSVAGLEECGNRRGRAHILCISFTR